MSIIPPSVWKESTGDEKRWMVFARKKFLRTRTTKKLERQSSVMALYIKLLPQYPDADRKGLASRIAGILGVDSRRVYDDLKEIFQGVSKHQVNQRAIERRMRNIETEAEEEN